MKTFVFLHDAFQGGWFWRDAARALHGLGCEVHTPSFTGCGARSHLAVQDAPSETYLEDIENLFLFEDIFEAIVVCHGYSGMLAPLLAQRLGSRVLGVVFLEAALPEQGESFMDLAPQPLAELLREQEQDGMVEPVRPSLFKVLHLGDSHADRLRSFPMRALAEPYQGPAPGQWPQSVFLRCGEEQNPFNSAMLARARMLGLEVRERDLDGVPVLARFGEIARVLEAMEWKHRPALSEGCCGTPRMPEEMRLLYCPHYRKRKAVARARGK